MLTLMQIWVLLSLCSCIAAASLELGVSANWGNAPFMVQLVEAVAGYNESLYIPVMKSILQDAERGNSEWEDDEDEFEESHVEDGGAISLSDRDLYYRVIGGLSPIDTGFTNLNLVNKIYSPRIEAHYLHYNQVVRPELASKVAKKCATDSFGEPLDYPLGAWVKYGDKIYCSESDLYALQTSKSSEATLTFDRVVGSEGPLLVLYGDPQCNRFFGIYNTLLPFAESGKLRFVWRYVPNAKYGSNKMSGYGISLVAKEQHTKALSDGKPVGDIFKFLSQVKAKKSPLVEIPADRLQELSLKVTSFILHEDNSKRFALLKEILHNLPQYASHILELEAPPNHPEVKLSASKNAKIGAGYESLGIYVNGAVTHRLETDLPSLIQKLTREVNLIQEMISYGFNAEQAKLIFSKFALLSAFKETEFRNGATNNRYAVYRDRYVREDKNSGGVVFFNDLDKDDSYNLYSRDRKEVYLQSTSQLRIGQIPPLRENVHDIIFVLNFANKHQLRVFFTLSKVVLDRGLAQQVGVLPIVENEKDAYITDLFYRIMEMGESTEALALLYKYYDAQSEAEEELFNKIDLPEDKVGSYHHHNRSLDKFSINEASVIINGVIHSMRSSNWQAAMGTQITHDVRLLQQKIRGGFDEGLPLKDVLYENAKNFRNTKVIPVDPANIRYKKVSLEMLNKACTFKSASDAASLSGTFWLIGDFNSDEISSQFVSLLEFMETYRSKAVQIKILHTTKDRALLDELFDKFGKVPLTSTVIKDIISRVEVAKSAKSNKFEYDNEMLSLLAKNHIQVHFPSMLFNSRYFRLNKLFTLQDLQLLLEYEFPQRLGIFDEITDAYPEQFFWKPTMHFKKDPTITGMDWFDMVSSTVSNSFFLEDSLLLSDVSRFDFSSLNYYNSIDLTRYDVSKPIDILAIIDPLDEVSQKLLSLLTSLADLPFVNARVLLLPLSGKEGSYKLNRFYGDSFLSSTPNFDTDGFFLGPKDISFGSLPKDTHFSSEPDLPSRWYTIKGQNSENIDLTDIKLDEDIHALYNLTKLAVEAYVKDVFTAASIPGLVLTAQNGVERVEGYTLKNLGYLQFLLGPGEWRLLLKEGTGSEDHYDLLSASDNRYEANNEGVVYVPISVSSLKGSVINPRIRKKSQHDMEDAFSPSLKKRKTRNADINVFSIASGHTYEKLMAIMMLSVMKNTKKNVKFWLLENFLSAHFTEQLPLLALEYGFKYEFVRYKWPLWLRKQQQLHRTVWGYKMLFLDALFPEDLDNIIFVDADQIARTDLSELANLDLEGAPYAFPPMCESRKDMEGYRFWKQGYWKNVLKDDLKYHISALYVVDLKMFRKSLVGDKLRTHYQKLSSDPNSLSNLDQDLPNNLQRLVPIFTLPQDWLWCETWCSEELKKSAKMIDLCNDPTSLESKLERARRLIPEWESYSKDLQRLGLGNLGVFHGKIRDEL